MMICHCRGVNDQVIADLVDDESVTVDDVVERCGAGSDCGGCHDSIQWVINRVRMSHNEETAAKVALAR